MKVEGLKRLSKEEVNAISIKVLQHFDVNYFSIVRATPIEALVQNLTNYSLGYDDSAHLGYANDGSRILGCYIPSKKMILVDCTLKKVPTKFNFVLAHELGHFALHRKVIISENEDDKITDCDKQIFQKKRQLETDFDFMEWQANYFASVIMLPTDILIKKLIEIRKRLGLAWKGRVFVDDQQCNQQDYSETLRLLMNYFTLSKTAIEIRLKGLNLIEDQRKKGNNVSSIADIISNINFSERQ